MHCVHVPDLVLYLYPIQEWEYKSYILFALWSHGKPTNTDLKQAMRRHLKQAM